MRRSDDRRFFLLRGLENSRQPRTNAKYSAAIAVIPLRIRDDATDALRCEGVEYLRKLCQADALAGLAFVTYTINNVCFREKDLPL